MEDLKDLKNISLKKFFKEITKITEETLKENPNYLVRLKIDIKFGGDTEADAKIIIDESTYVLYDSVIKSKTKKEI